VKKAEKIQHEYPKTLGASHKTLFFLRVLLGTLSGSTSSPQGLSKGSAGKGFL